MLLLSQFKSKMDKQTLILRLYKSKFKWYPNKYLYLKILYKHYYSLLLISFNYYFLIFIYFFIWNKTKLFSKKLL